LADSTQMYQIVMNLCTNAVQAMREKGDALEIGLEEIFFDQGSLLGNQELTPGPYVKLTVSDNGPGIAPEIIDKIFDPFFTTKGVGEGTGMGLAVVYGIVKSYGGSITVSSQPGEDATFTVLLPRIISQKTDDHEAQIFIPRGQGQILVIDDEDILVQMSKSMLENLGYEVTTANDSLKAMEIFQAQPDTFDLVITDQTMPHIDGLQIARKIRQMQPNIPIILCTGFSEKVSQETVRAAGINVLLMKPFNLHDLGQTVKKVLDKAKQ
jgi:CheY-like chemotaxis protein